VAPVIDTIAISAYKIPTTGPEADGTFWWDATTVIVVEASAESQRGIGYSYADVATAHLIEEHLVDVVQGKSAMAITEAWMAMGWKVRNLGRPGVVSMAIAAVDNALWDLKGRLLGISVAGLLGSARESIPAYGSGGFTTYSNDELKRQFRGWVDEGMRAVKMKIGTDPGADLERVGAAREAIGDDAELYVDANGAFRPKQALAFAWAFADLDVTWFEEPVSSDDLAGLRLIREQGPPGMEIAAGEYGYDTPYFGRMLTAGAVDVLQADATRCGGITGFMQVNALCEAHCIKLSAHTAPTIHAHTCCAATRAMNVEYFHDHSRIEQMIFDGAIRAVDGELRPDLSRRGLGIELKKADAEKFRVYGG
jgi:L-alanine-DL-glutamate epimerase-like enolase superfamily enzyme